jgi:hypothetical protein
MCFSFFLKKNCQKLTPIQELRMAKELYRKLRKNIIEKVIPKEEPCSSEPSCDLLILNCE